MVDHEGSETILLPTMGTHDEVYGNPGGAEPQCRALKVSAARHAICPLYDEHGEEGNRWITVRRLRSLPVSSL
jgi:hypothetical protein